MRLYLQYVSCSWDKTIRVWNAWKKPKRKRVPKTDDKGNPLGNMSGENVALDENSASGLDKKVGFTDGEEPEGKAEEEEGHPETEEE